MKEMVNSRVIELKCYYANENESLIDTYQSKNANNQRNTFL